MILSPRMFLVLVAPLVVLTSGCSASALNSFHNLGRTAAANPAVGGQPLTFRKSGKGAPGSSSYCTVWPIETEGKVTLVGDKICVEATVSEVSQSGGIPATFLSADPTGDLTAQVSAASFEGDQRKIGICSYSSPARTMAVWTTTYSGCIPNQAKSGGPLVTAKSNFLDLHKIAGWKFSPSSSAQASH